MKSAGIVYATNEVAYVRHNAQKIPANTNEKMRRLELDKGIAHFEDEVVPEAEIDDAANSEIMSLFASLSSQMLLQLIGLQSKNSAK